MTTNPKIIESYEQIKTKMGLYPLFIAPLSIFNFYTDMLDVYKAEMGIGLRCSKMLFPFPLATGLNVGAPANELLLVDIEFIEPFRKWLASHRMTRTKEKEYHAVIPTFGPIGDPIRRAANKVIDPVLDVPVAIDVITYSGTKGALTVIQPPSRPVPMTLNFQLKPPDPVIIKEAQAFFSPKG